MIQQISLITVIAFFFHFSSFGTNIGELIYEGKQGRRYVYYDDSKGYINIEFGYDFFGFHDHLIKSEKREKTRTIIAKSKYGLLYKRQNRLYYANSKHRLEIVLVKRAYTRADDLRRLKIFEHVLRYSTLKTRKLLRINQQEENEFLRQVKADFESYRDHDTIPLGYMP